MKAAFVNLPSFLQAKNTEDNNGLRDLLSIIGNIGIRINREVHRAPITGIGDYNNTTNVHGEMVKRLDMFAHNLFLGELSSSGLCSAIVSEEDEACIRTPFPKAPYIVHIDPLDGSSNIDVNVAVGSIFSVYRKSAAGNVMIHDILQPGYQQCAAGYLLYSSSTMYVFSTGNGVHGFTLDHESNSFLLSHPTIEIPTNSNIYSVNEGYLTKFTQPVYDYLMYCKSREKEDGGHCSGRYIGSMVADLHRSILKGGVFLYPSTDDLPHGKLRLNYECNPFAYLIEQAGGKAIDCYQRRILTIQPDSLHQKSSIIIGSATMVDKAEEFLRNEKVVYKKAS